MFQFQIGQLAVYPAHGVGVIEAVRERPGSGSLEKFYIMRLLDSDMIIMIPTGVGKTDDAAAPTHGRWFSVFCFRFSDGIILQSKIICSSPGHNAVIIPLRAITAFW